MVVVTTRTTRVGTIDNNENANVNNNVILQNALCIWTVHITTIIMIIIIIAVQENIRKMLDQYKIKIIVIVGGENNNNDLLHSQVEAGVEAEAGVENAALLQDEGGDGVLVGEVDLGLVPPILLDHLLRRRY